ncbi:MAG: hypothetical protein KDA28_15135 [Phycisphaerales bacterium]|nr:hypothetical protein [Phycisphaerales bacterium]
MDAFDTVRMTLVATGALSLLIALVRRLRPGAERRCPTPRWSWIPFLARRCWYDVTDLDTCPECGKAVHRIVTRRRRVRFTRLGIVLLVMGVGAAPLYRTWYYGRLIRYTPTPVLAAGHIAWPASMSRRATLTLMERLRTHPESLSTRAVAFWYGQRFRHGEIGLRTTLVGFGPYGVHELETSLRDPDWIVRQHAAEIIAYRDLDVAPEILMPVLLEALEDDTHWSNARDALDYMVEHPDVAEPYLATVMRDGWTQKRLLACGVVAFAGIEPLRDTAMSILIGHLRDNDVRGDRRLAIQALWFLGSDALAALEASRWSKDRQQRDSIDLIRRLILDTSTIEDRPERPNRVARAPQRRVPLPWGLGDWQVASLGEGDAQGAQMGVVPGVSPDR